MRLPAWRKHSHCCPYWAARPTKAQLPHGIISRKGAPCGQIPCIQRFLQKTHSCTLPACKAAASAQYPYSIYSIYIYNIYIIYIIYNIYIYIIFYICIQCFTILRSPDDSLTLLNFNRPNGDDAGWTVQSCCRPFLRGWPPLLYPGSPVLDLSGSVHFGAPMYPYLSVFIHIYPCWCFFLFGSWGSVCDFAPPTSKQANHSYTESKFNIKILQSPCSNDLSLQSCVSVTFIGALPNFPLIWDCPQCLLFQVRDIIQISITHMSGR